MCAQVKLRVAAVPKWMQGWEGLDDEMKDEVMTNHTHRATRGSNTSAFRDEWHHSSACVV